MKYVVFTAAMPAALMGAGILAHAQTSAAAIPNEGPAGLLRPGMVFKAPQFCPRLQGAGVTLSLQSTSRDGTTGSIVADIDCFNTKRAIDGRFNNGSITLRGNDVTVVFFSTFSAKFGAEWKGTWTMENGKAVLRFGESVLRAGDGPWTTPELVFR
jgi:hypothetical protein